MLAAFRYVPKEWSKLMTVSIVTTKCWIGVAVGAGTGDPQRLGRAALT